MILSRFGFVIIELSTICLVVSTDCLFTLFNKLFTVILLEEQYMVGENIKRLRVEKGLTQKDLAEQLFVTSQAISRWENSEVEPSLTTIAKIASIFEVSVDEIMGLPVERKEPQVIIQKEYVPVEQPKPVLAVCEVCNKPIYASENIIRKRTRHRSHVSCRDCERKKLDLINKRTIAKAISRRKLSFILGGSISIVWIAISLSVALNNNQYDILFPNILVAIMAFTFVSCLLLSNNFIKDMVSEIFSWGFVKMPGLIFSLSLDGIIWLITVKLALWILGIFLIILFGIAAIVLGLIMSVFVYPFAISKNYKRPEASDFSD